MSYIPDLNQNDRQMIAQFIVSQRGEGLLLPYDEYPFIDRWLSLGSADQLLLILDDILPDYFRRPARRGRAPSIKHLHGSVCKRLRALQSKRT